jgi:hypothetical protein
MRLLRAWLVGLGPFEKLAVPFVDEDGKPRLVTVIHGGGGVGKSSLLAAIGTTRPGHCVAQSPRVEARPRPNPEAAAQAHVACDWLLGQDDPLRPHPLRIGSPNVRLSATEEEEAFRRREQLLFDRIAADGGFAFLAISGTRWFSRQPIAFSAPARTIARYDVRSAMGSEDPSRADLARETKQALAYAAIAPALAGAKDLAERRFDLLGEAMQSVVTTLLEPLGFIYRGIDPFSFEPLFTGPFGRTFAFDALPTRARHLASMAALSVRTLWAAYPTRDPRESEGVITIDDVDLHQDAVTAQALVPAFRSALPEVQWILTTTSPLVAASCDVREVLALRRLPELDQVELFAGSEARTH